MEEAAEKETTALGRDIAYAKAALATGVKDFERGLDLAGKIKDKQLNEGVADWLLYRAALRLADQSDFTRAYELSRRSTNPSQHAALLVILAQRSAKLKELVRARQWLLEARQVVAKAEPDEALARVAFGVAAAFGQFDIPTALDALADAVRLAARSRVALDAVERAPQLSCAAGAPSCIFRRTSSINAASNDSRTIEGKPPGCGTSGARCWSGRTAPCSVQASWAESPLRSARV